MVIADRVFRLAKLPTQQLTGMVEVYDVTYNNVAYPPRTKMAKSDNRQQLLNGVIVARCIASLGQH